MKSLSFTRSPIALVALLLLSACADKQPPTEATALVSGIDTVGMDNSVRPQDDFYRYANGGWLDRTEIPADEVGWGSYMTLRKESLEQSRVIVEDAAKSTENDPAKQKIGDYYSAFLDEQRVETLGIGPVSDYLAAIDKLATHDQVAAFLGAG